MNFNLRIQCKMNLKLMGQNSYRVQSYYKLSVMQHAEVTPNT